MIFGVMGKARSGKDTFAEFLAEELFKDRRSKYILMAYATEIKLRAQKDFDLSWDQLWGDLKEVQDKRFLKSRETEEYWTPREIMQGYGQFYRSIDHDYWVKALFEVIDDREYKNVIVTDVRFPNEVQAIRDRNGLIFHVIRDDRPSINGSCDISETALDEFKADVTVDNSLSLVELREAAKGGVDIVKIMMEGV